MNNCDIINKLCMLMLVFFLTHCATDQREDTMSNIPDYMRPYLVSDPCPACSILEKLDWETNSKVIRGIQHPEFGRTFHVNIDHNRKIIKLRPVRDKREVVLFYDPFHKGSIGLEVGSTYIQSRCPCGGNRFQLAVGLTYPPGQPENISKLILAGKCTLCNKERILFTQ